MLILSIDSSTRGCSVALHLNDLLLACYDLNRDRSAAELLTMLIEQILEHNGYSLSSLDAIAVAKGPGSYTGLRVAVSTAKGLCYALDKPLIAVNTLKAMAAQVIAYYPRSSSGAAESAWLFCPMIDARRMEVFCAFYDEALNVIAPTAAVIVDENSFESLLSRHNVVFFGDGAAKCRAVLSGHSNAFFVDSPVHSSAAAVGRFAGLLYREGAFEDTAVFEPFYLKDFVGTKPKKT